MTGEGHATDDLGPCLTGMLGRDRDAPVYRLRGELDLAGAGALAARLRQVSETAGRDVALDLSQLTFIDSTGLMALVDVHAALARRGRTMSARGMRPEVRRLLELFELGGLFDEGRPPGAAD